MADWKEEETAFLDELLSGERPNVELCCRQCNHKEDLWRCVECFGGPIYCMACMAKTHRTIPFHRVEEWKGTHFESAWLWQTGLVLHLGHFGDPCPTSGPPINPDLAWQAGEDPLTAAFSGGARPARRVVDGHKVVVVLHTNGVHHCLVRPCCCPNAGDDKAQFLAAQLYPASLKDIRTVATFALLDDHHMSVLECHCSTYAFYNRLCRITNKAFPQTVPVSTSVH